MVAVCVLPLAQADDLPADSAVDSGRGPHAQALAAYLALSDSQSRNYDRSQDISPRQMVLLLEVAERTGTNLGQALATGEHESARTWNDHVRPTLKSGSLGLATGVWQFQPVTFHSIIKTYGAALLAASSADPASGRERLDLGYGPFIDAAVRTIIQETVDGQRGVEDEGLQLLRQNFGVLAFAKHYLSLDSGAATPEEDYLFHFLGAGQGRRVLELAQGEARNTLCVKSAEVPPDLVAQTSGLQVGNLRVVVRKATAMVRDLDSVATDPLSGPGQLTGGGRITTFRSRVGSQTVSPGALESGVVPPFSFTAPPISSQWGFPADSPTVTGNLGMFYRDGKGQTQPYTWAEFMENLARRVRADQQPALVRAKYGVGFSLKGGDVPGRAFDPEAVSGAAEYGRVRGLTLRIPESLVAGTLDADEAAYFKQRLGALVAQGDDEPTDTLPPETWSALVHLGLLPEGVDALSTSHPAVRKALHAFRVWSGKDEPDDPAQADLLLPAERIALEVYDRRLARYGALQACQAASLGDAPDLARIRKLPIGLQRRAAPQIVLVQKALAAEGLLQPPTKKHVWRDKRRKRHVVYKQAHFAGEVDKATVAALSTFQLRNGLGVTEGVLDAVTLELLGLPTMGREIFSPISGAQCRIPGGAGTTFQCEVRVSDQGQDLGALSPSHPRPTPRILDVISCPDCSGAKLGES